MSLYRRGCQQAMKRMALFSFGTFPHNVYYTARPDPKHMPNESQIAELSKRLPTYTPARPFLV